MPDRFPPLGPTRLMDSLVDYGYTDVDFYNLDYHRPKEEAIVEYVKNCKPDIIGISAVISTSYRYLKYLSPLLRKICPNVPQIVGGNMAAAAEVMMNKMPIDLCVSGDGEETIVHLVKHYEAYGHYQDNEALRSIKGVILRSRQEAGQLFYTEHSDKIPNNKIRQINWDIIEKSGGLDYYLPDHTTRFDFQLDPRSKDPSRGRRMGSIMTTKGCVSRCTFCHRWEKGYKILDVDHLIEYVKMLKEKYGVGYLNCSEENFGSSIQHVEEFVQKIKPLDMLWVCSGMRVKSPAVNPDTLKRMNEAGCVAIYYGMESGSDKILTIMEKGATAELNLRAIRLTHEANMYTTVQLVVGMPGETRETIEETIDFAKKAIEITANKYMMQFSINYAQALPGTPHYEYARHHGFLGKTIDDEEAYLLKTSDVDASSLRHYFNMTDAPIGEVVKWARMIRYKSMHHYRFTLRKEYNEIDQALGYVKTSRGDYLRLSPTNPLLLYASYYLEHCFYNLISIHSLLERSDYKWKNFLKLLNDKPNIERVNKLSLRKVVNELPSRKLSLTVQPLREGR